MAIVTGKTPALARGRRARRPDRADRGHACSRCWRSCRISLRPGNFATGSLIPSDDQPGALEAGARHALPGRRRQPGAAAFPVLRWLWNSVKVATHLGAPDRAPLDHRRLCLRAPAVSRQAGILNSLLLLQMFPAVLALVAIYAIFDTHRQRYVPWLGIDTHAGLILAYWAASRCTSGPSRATSTPSRSRSRKAPRSTAPRPGRPSAYVLLPMAVPILMVVFLLAFIGTIIEYPVASILLREEHNLTLAVGSQVLPLRAEVPVGRLRRRGHAVGPADHPGVPRRATLDRLRPDGGRRQGLIGCRKHSGEEPRCFGSN